MVDIDIYKARIGTFSTSLVSYSRFTMVPSEMQGRVFKLCFLILFSLSILCSRYDPSIESNPGPASQSNKFLHKSEDEKKLFSETRKINSNITNIHSHREFLIRCLINNMSPRCLRSKFSLATRRTAEDRISQIVLHYDNELNLLYEKKEKVCSQLKDISGLSRFNFLLDTLDSFDLKEKKILVKTKERNNLLSSQEELNTSNSDSAPDSGLSWIPDLHLTTTEKRLLLNNEDTCDRLMME